MEKVELQILRDPSCSDIELPNYQSEHAAGMDVRAAVTEPVTLERGEITLIPTGIRVAVSPGFEVQVRPRSGLALKHGITVVNSPGTIDADYRGEVGLIVGNFGKEPYTVERGMRMAQLVVAKVARAEVMEVAQLPDTERGEGGFGSSGVK